MTPKSDIIFSRVIVITAFMVALAGCRKETEPAEDSSINLINMRVFQDVSVTETYDIVSGGDVALAAYQVSSGTDFQVLNDQLEVLHSFSLNGSVFRKIIFETETDLFHIVLSNALYKVDKSGTIVFENLDFFDALNNVFVGVDFALAPDGGYFICGTIFTNGRAFIARVDASGNQIFRKAFAVDLDGQNSFTSALVEGETIVVAGSRASGRMDKRDEVFLIKYDFDGNLISEFIHEVGEPYFSEEFNIKIFGRELISWGDGVDYTYGIGPSLPISGTSQSQISRINLSDSTITSTELNYDRENHLAGSGGALPELVIGGANIKLQSIGTGLLRLQNGDLFGVANNTDDQTERLLFNGQSNQPLTLSVARGYVFRIANAYGVPDVQWVDRNVENQLSAVCQFNSGHILCLGYALGINQERNLMYLSYE